MKYFLWVLWTILSIGIFFSTLSPFLGSDTVHTGHELVFSTDSNRFMEIEDEDEVVLEAASDRFFAFRREGGETLVGQEKDPPLGWEGNNYFSIDPIQIQPGQWFTEGNGYVYIKITNNDALTVKEVLVNQGMAEFAAFLLTFLIWAGGSYIGNIFFED